MSLPLILALAPALALAPPTTATHSPEISAAASASSEEFAEIVVDGLRSPYRLTPTQLREAIDAYAAQRAQHAPDAPLRFEVFGFRTDPTLAGVRFRLLADNGDAIPIVLDANGRFTLPTIDYSAKLYALQADRRSGSVRVRPLILSPGSSVEDRRLGDVRLNCAVAWAMMRQTLSVVARGMVGAVGGACASGDISVFFKTDRPIASATVVAGDAVKPVPLGPDGGSFRYIGYDRALPDEARIRLTYR